MFEGGGGVKPPAAEGTKNLHALLLRRTREGWNCRFQKNTPHGRWGQGPGSVDPRFPAGLPFPVPEILVFVAFGDSGKIFQQFSRNFPGTFLQNSRKDPRNSHSLLEFSDLPSVQSTRGRRGRSIQFRGKLFYLQLELFCLQLSFFAYSPLRPLLEALSHCKQKSSNCK